jgi:hypothetical protein
MEYVNKLQEWIGYLPHYPLEISQKILVSILPLFRYAPHFCVRFS